MGRQLPTIGNEGDSLLRFFLWLLLSRDDAMPSCRFFHGSESVLSVEDEMVVVLRFQ